MKAIIFGIAGQDGYYLKKVLNEKGISIHGISRSMGDWLTGDVGDPVFVENLIKELQPEYIFHLAANSTTRHYAALENHKTIESGTLYILEACHQFSKHSRIFISGSAVQFKNVGEPIDEETPFAPLSPYAVSRISSVYMARYYRSLGLKAYAGYFFNHDSPLRTERHVNQKVVAAVKRIAAGSGEKLEIGNLSTEKEFNDAADIVEAVWTLVNQEKHFEAVLGSGRAYSIEKWVKICFELAGLNWEEHTIVRTGFVAEYERLVANPAVIFSMGWQPQTSIEMLAQLMYEAAPSENAFCNNL